MKIQNHSWWIGAIVGAILTLTLTGGPAQDNPGMLIIVGLVSGAFWGWIIGLIIDKIIGNPKIPVPVQHTQRKPFNEKKEIPKEVNEPIQTSNKNEYRTDTLNSRGIIIETFQEEMDRSLADYKRKNSEALDDPIFGPMKIMNFINVSSEEYKRSLMNNRDKFRFSEEEIDEIIKKIHSDTLEKNLH
jgi:hypothetical protein